MYELLQTEDDYRRAPLIGESAKAIRLECIPYAVYTLGVREQLDVQEEAHEEQPQPSRKPLVWLSGEVKTPPFTTEGRMEVGMLLRFLQEGEHLGMPQVEPQPDMGPRCGALRVRDGNHNWWIMYRLDPDAILIFDVYAKKTPKIPDEVFDRCLQRLNRYDQVVKASPKKTKPDGDKEDGSD